MPSQIHPKIGDPIDWGAQDDFSYENMEWFKDPPPRPPPSAPATVSDPYIPHPEVVEKNDQFVYALKHAPNVLYARYKQYGQLGVLGWCSEFSELIDAIKQVGFEGNMFLATRQQALQTCSDILKLRLDVKMQIIIMYLSSQVARLRRFLDGESAYDDYPQTEFPIESRQYTRH
ncbi:hypothetical protein BD410DRAFT_812225 [Rickenella mellea]|uniref:Uncharacterized protein n=1 Tax=Rickenella mellea TaxID=50990 RepID=A0A4Y7QMD9_9AGAM|nr:hypothetical protein BD410DRAFT_812225 [Rickenella mellea]